MVLCTQLSLSLNVYLLFVWHALEQTTNFQLNKFSINGHTLYVSVKDVMLLLQASKQMETPRS